MKNNKNPQIENGFLKISNELYEAICKIRIPGESRQLFDVIIRMTYGYNKKESIISITDFSNYTGLLNANCVRGLKKLKNMNLITVYKNGNRNMYQVQKDYSKWIDSIKSDSIKSDNKTLSKTITPIIKSDNSLLIKAFKNNFKDNKDSEVTRLYIYWQDVLYNPRLLEKEYIELLYNKFGYKKTMDIIMKLGENGFRRLVTIKQSLDEKGNIIPKNNKNNNKNNNGEVLKPQMTDIQKEMRKLLDD